MNLPPSLRPALKKPLGRLVSGLDSLSKEDVLITVGDEASKAVLSDGFKPKIVVYDGKTARQPIDVPESLEGYGDKSVTVENPPGTLQKRVFQVIRQALDYEGSTTVFVEGEEDLTALAAIMEAPNGTVVVYGQPGEGMVLVDVNEVIKKKVSKIIGEMEDGC
ncbi:MAG: DUF359 domain-containing protein [Candidatus Altiarchaeota archaeon]